MPSPQEQVPVCQLYHPTVESETGVVPSPETGVVTVKLLARDQGIVKRGVVVAFANLALASYLEMVYRATCEAVVELRSDHRWRGARTALLCIRLVVTRR